MFMVLLILAFSVAQVLLNMLAVVQFLWLLLAKAPNPFLREFGMSLALWFSQAAQFLSCATDEKPFPWKDWPHPGSALVHPK